MEKPKNIRFGYCLQKMDECGYCKNQPCGWEELNMKKRNLCPMYTNNPIDIFKQIEDLEELKIIGIEIFKNKGRRLDLLLNTCYKNINRESALEHLKKVFSEEFCVRILFPNEKVGKQ